MQLKLLMELIFLDSVRRPKERVFMGSAPVKC